MNPQLKDLHPDYLIAPRWLVPVVPYAQVLENHLVAVSGDKISAIVDCQHADSLWPEVERIELPDHVLMPGLINTHCHSAMTLFRGFADDLPLHDWLYENIWPAEQRWVGPDFVRDGTELAVVEMLRSGTTCFNDNYFFPDVAAAVAVKAGMRITAGLLIIDLPTAWAADADEYFRRGIEVHQNYLDEPLVRTAFAPHAPYSVSDLQLERIRLLADEMDIPIHMHLQESAWEIQDSMEKHGIRPMARLEKLGLLSPRLMAVHMTQVTDHEIDLLASHGVHVLHCPESNLKLASGFCPVHKLKAAGVNITIATDGAASNNDLDLLGEAQTASFMAKGVAGNPKALPVADALEMITINAARALGMENEIGSIEVGKQADFCALDFSAPESHPVHDVLSQIIYASHRQQVTDVWVRGERLLKDGVLVRMDIGDIISRADQWGERLQRHRHEHQQLSKSVGQADREDK
ncbi:MAG: TRZ/ATZ family hydrolase [Proteobacteria bacterium]|nr:TRZ/ATZ family hydrolase [Pseudomonadota bacterium]